LAYRAEFPEKLQGLFQPARYKVYYGGRGSAKSWSVARALLIIGAGRTLRIVCAREIQKSIAQSVHQLLKDQIAALGLTDFYRVTDTAIIGLNGTEFTFVGLKHNIQSVKSLEGADICWVEEAQTVSKSSWATLIPTIRKPESEIWITFNPDLNTDDTYVRFVKNPPAGRLSQGQLHRQPVVSSGSAGRSGAPEGHRSGRLQPCVAGQLYQRSGRRDLRE
jgi:phage terminase large subunit